MCQLDKDKLLYIFSWSLQNVLRESYLPHTSLQITTWHITFKMGWALRTRLMTPVQFCHIDKKHLILRFSTFLSISELAWN